MSSIGGDKQDMLKKLIKVWTIWELTDNHTQNFNILRVKFLKSKSYENKTLCRDFIQNAPEFFFSTKTWKSWSKQILSLSFPMECIYILFGDPDEFMPKGLFFA